MNKVSWITGVVAFGLVIASAVIQFARGDIMGSLQGLFASLAAVGLAWTVWKLWSDAKGATRVADRMPLLVTSISGALFALALFLGAFAHL